MTTSDSRCARSRWPISTNPTDPRYTDFGTILPPQGEWTNRRAPAAHAHARCRRYPQGRRRGRHRDVPLHVPKIFHSREPDAIQCGDSPAADVFLLSRTYEGEHRIISSQTRRDDGKLTEKQLVPAFTYCDLPIPRSHGASTDDVRARGAGGFH
jgi:hypothetical protein